MRRTNVRFMLFLLVFIFVFVSFLVFNVFFSFDLNRVTFAHRFRFISPSVTSLPLCLNVNSSEFLRPGALHEFQTRCGMKNTSISSKIRLVHFVHVALDAVPAEDDTEQQQENKEQFTYLQFAAVQSIKRVLEPDTMIMHYLETPRGVWYTQCQRHLGLHQVLPPVSFDSRFPTLNRHKRRQIMQVLIMLRMLKKHGGVAFSDFNTFLLRRINVGMEEEMVVASQMKSNRGTFRMGLHMMQSPPGHPFVEYLERTIAEMVENNDVKLHEMELDQVVGQVVLEKYLEEHQAEIDANVTKSGSNIMNGVVIGTSNLFEFDGLHDLLTAKVEPSLAGKFRDVAGFHIDTYDFERNTADTEDIRTIERMQEELTVASEWKSLDTLLGAVVRLVVTANTSAELEPVFT